MLSHHTFTSYAKTQPQLTMKNTLTQVACLSLALTFSFFPSVHDSISIDLSGLPRHSIKTSVYVSEWSPVIWSNPFSTYGNFIYRTPELSEEVIHNSIILRFAKWEATGDLFALPLALNEESMLTMILQPGEIELYYYSDLPMDAPPVQFQYIIISQRSDSAMESTKAQLLADLEREAVDLKNYEQVMEYLNSQS